MHLHFLDESSATRWKSTSPSVEKRCARVSRDSSSNAAIVLFFQQNTTSGYLFKDVGFQDYLFQFSVFLRIKVNF